MKLLDILGKVGGAVIRNAVPGGGLIIDAVNEFLPDDKKLGPSCTGDDVQIAIQYLPPQQRAELLSRSFDVQIAAYDTVQAMLNAEANSRHTTRPRIALGAFRIVSFITITVVSIWAVAVLTGDSAMLSAIVGGWQFIAAAIWPFVALLWAYFGILKQEHKNRLNAANGSTAGTFSGILSTLLKR